MIQTLHGMLETLYNIETLTILYAGDNLDDTVLYDTEDTEDTEVRRLRHGRNRSSRLQDSSEDDDSLEPAVQPSTNQARFDECVSQEENVNPFHGVVTKGSKDIVPKHFQIPSDSAIDYRFLLDLPQSLIFETPEDDLTDPDLTDEENFIRNNYRFVKRKHHENDEIDICDLYPNKIDDLYSWVDACQSTDTCLIVCT